MTEDQLTLIATRIMDRVEKDGIGLQLPALVEELRAGLAIVEAHPASHTHDRQGVVMETDFEGFLRCDGKDTFHYTDGKWVKLAIF